jgi:hypothetical protein
VSTGRLPLWDRIWFKVQQTADRGECWLWSGAHSKKRRGQMRPVVKVARGEVVPVARIMCEWRNGPPPTPLHEAGHVCPRGENHRCVNPFHLVWMTRIENEQYKRIEQAVNEFAGASPNDEATPS